jgi:hypothetical protein
MATVMVVAKCDTCGCGYIDVSPHSKRLCIRHNVETRVKCPGRIIDIEPVPSDEFPAANHWRTIGNRATPSP